MAKNSIMKFISCREYTKLASKLKDDKLTTLEKLQYRFHHALCFTCRRYARQISILEKACSKILNLNYQQDINNHNCNCLSEESKSRIREKISIEQDA